MGLFSWSRSSTGLWLASSTAFASMHPLYVDRMKDYTNDTSTWRIVGMSLPLYLAATSTAYWISSHGNFRSALIRSTLFLFIALYGGPAVDWFVRVSAYDTCDLMRFDSALLVHLLNSGWNLHLCRILFGDLKRNEKIKEDCKKGQTLQELWKRLLPPCIKLCSIYKHFALLLWFKYATGTTESHQCMNQHPTTPASPLVGPGYKVIAHAESLTGYISVVELPMGKGNIRVMRCDHSIIGGGCILTSRRD
jgi:hypothetical protein